MTTESLSLQAEPRSVTGKKVKGLRRLGLTPIHVYGRGIEPTALQADAVTLRKIVAQAGSNIPVTVEEEGSSRFAFIREVQRHPLTEDILHVDFLQVPLTETIRSEVPVYLVGEAPAVRLMDGALNQVLQSLQVESFPLDVPQFVEVDISSLEDFERSIHVSDLSLGDKVTVLNDPEELVARVNAPSWSRRRSGERPPKWSLSEASQGLSPKKTPAEP